jgi:hypothetical protein
VYGVPVQCLSALASEQWPSFWRPITRESYPGRPEFVILINHVHLPGSLHINVGEAYFAQLIDLTFQLSISMRLDLSMARQNKL